MTPKEKAIELVDKYKKQLDTATPTLYRPMYQAKKCALIAVFEIFEVVPDIELWEYYVKVKQEIEKL